MTTTKKELSYFRLKLEAYEAAEEQAERSSAAER